jgi:hypothetical protein
MAVLEALRLDGLSLNGYGDGFTNLVTNPSFESATIGTTGWGGGAAGPIGSGPSTLARSTAQFNDGVASMSVTTPSAVNTTGASVAIGSLAAGQTVTARVMVRTPTTQNMRITLQDNLLGNGPQTTTVSVTANTWTPLTVTWTPSALSANAALYVYQVTTSLAQTWFVDSAIVVVGTTAPTYFDGDTTGYYWTGTPYNSTSASSPFLLTSLSMPVPAKRPDWISGADSDGALLAADPRFENRVIEARVAVVPQASMDLALSQIALLIDKLEECERQANGLGLAWVPANATAAAVTFRCLSGDITDLPIDITNGWFVNSPEFTIRLTCLPFGEKTEVQAATVTSSAPIITQELTGVGGDVPALGRLVVTDAASQNRRWVAWGLESRYYPTSSPPSLIVDSSSMVTSGFAGVTATNAGAYSSATNNVIQLTTRVQSQAVCGLGNLTHVGQFRAHLRFWTSATTINLRLSYKANDGPLRSLPYVTPVTTGFNHVDLGLINVSEAVAGTQRWTGQIEAYSTAAGGETFQVDALWLVPAEMYGRARGSYSYQPGAVSAFDDFNSIVAGTALNARVAPSGGTWATSGPGPDFVAADAPAATDETMSRPAGAADATPEFAILGATNYTNTEVGVSIYGGQVVPVQSVNRAVVARWVDASNYAALRNGPSSTLTLEVVIAGVTTTLATGTGSNANLVWQALRLVIFASGVAYGTLLNASGTPMTTLRGQHAALATGGALATGKPGFYDRRTNTTATIRYYDNFYAAAPAAEPIAINSTRSIEFQSKATVRADSTGTYYGDAPEYVGARFTIPPAGGPGRKARVAVIARRLDVEASNDDTLVSNATTDSTTLTIFKTERVLAVPR